MSTAGRGSRPATPLAPRAWEQADLFSGRGTAGADDNAPERPPAVAPAALSDDALIAAIPVVAQAACRALAQEAVRRRLLAAVPALESLCRRFKGFGRDHTIAEQEAALRAMAALGGAEAIAAIRRIVVQDIVAGPGLPEALRAAAALRCVLPEQTAAPLLRHADPAIRSLACRCAPRSEQTLALLASLLEDLNPGVAAEAAKALAHMGRSDGRPLLLRLLRQKPDAHLLAAVAAVADDECTVWLGRVGLAHPALREAALEALDSIETPRAAALRASLARFGVS